MTSVGSENAGQGNSHGPCGHARERAVISRTAPYGTLTVDGYVVDVGMRGCQRGRGDQRRVGVRTGEIEKWLGDGPATLEVGRCTRAGIFDRLIAHCSAGKRSTLGFVDVGKRHGCEWSQKKKKKKQEKKERLP